MPNIYLLLGSNLDDRLHNISQARNLIYERIGASIQESEIYETKAWGIEDQGPFLNQALHIIGDDEPAILLQKIKLIEAEIGRTKTIQWGPRIIDIDVLFYDDLIYESEKLTIPHKEIENRRFTLIPLNDIASYLVHPKIKVSIKKLLSRCKDKLEVTKFVVSSSATKPKNEDLPTAMHS